MNRQESAEMTALQALGWIVSQPDSLGAFLNASGMAQSELAGLAGDPVFLAALLDHVMQSDEQVIACCEALDLPYTALREARAHLPGGLDPHWT